ncbi:FIST signal transduction protein [Lachnobacterium bovis]|uniref:FIST signal transduction protein n=1 Tax=Lachnobacterium bovis TaxID=140626 RepID=UPI0003B5C65C|nr:FIST N-terminal domain-containing protein [Lachnobacterium bovis]
MKTFVGSGSGATSKALQEATSGLQTPKMIMFIAPYEQLADTAKLIKEKYPNAMSFGTCGSSLANGAVSDNATVVVGFFEDAVIKCGLIQELSTCPLAYIRKVQENLSAVSPGNEDTVVLEFCTNNEEKLVSTLYTCVAKRNVPLVGGTVFGVPAGKTSYVAYEGKVYSNSCAYAVIKNTTGKIRTYKENIYEKNDIISHFATKVDTETRTLIELDGRPAADVYSEALDIPKNKIIDNVLKNPMGRVVEDKVYISSMFELKGNGALVNYKQINKNDCIYFLKLGDYDEIEKQQREEIKQDAKKISFVFSVDCIYRYILYQNENYLQTYAKNMSMLGPHVGVIGGGEQYINQHCNQTLVCAVFE